MVVGICTIGDEEPISCGRLQDVLHEMSQDGYAVTTEVVATFSPYLREHIKRFGEYVIDLETIPPPLQPDKTFLSQITT